MVDDEEAFLLSLVDGLQAFADRFRVLIARNGREALDVVRLIQVDLVVTDLKMPDMDGFELLEELREVLPSVPTVVMTALGTSEVQDRLRRFRPLQCLEKPFGIDEVVSAIVGSLAPRPMHARGETSNMPPLTCE